MARAESIAGARRFVPFDEALSTILARAPEARAETVPLDESLGRTAARSLSAHEPLPGFTNSAMDGFAVRVDDVRAARHDAPRPLRILEAVAAGGVPTRTLGAGEATRIMTGAPVPEGTEAVVPIEQTAPGGEGIILVHAPVERGQNLRSKGEDLRVGDPLVARGSVLGPAEIALLAALGHDLVEVARRPVVGVISTGDELVPPGAPLRPGAIRDSNSHMLRALVRAAGAEPGPVWHVADDVEAVRASVFRTADTCDVILTLGGVSAGDYDVVRLALQSLGNLELWRVGMRPGQPQAFGEIQGRLFFGLPGNPVSCAVVFENLVRPALWKMMGRERLDRPRLTAVLADDVESKLGRRDFLRVRLDPVETLEGPPPEGTPPGILHRARLTGTQSSGAVSSLAKADGLAVIPEDWERGRAGQVVEVILWKSGA